MAGRYSSRRPCRRTATPSPAVPLIPDLPHQLLASLEDSPACVGLFDPLERLRYANRSFLDALATTLDGAPSWEAIMRECHRRHLGLLIETDDIEAWLARVRRTFRKVPVRRFESDLVDGRWLSITETLRDDGWCLVVGTDVTPMKTNEADLQRSRDSAVRHSLTDPLTRLHNRRSIFMRLAELLGHARHLRYPLTVAAIDLDHFKAINDRHGHAVGDRVLEHFGTQLRRHLRPADVAGRIGGEEFLIVLPNADVGGADQALSRLRQLIDGDPPDLQRPELRYGFSAGLTLAQPADTIELLYQRADRALYLAKSAGRGRNETLDGAADYTFGTDH